MNLNARTRKVWQAYSFEDLQRDCIRGLNIYFPPAGSAKAIYPFEIEGVDTPPGGM
jgi:hypothetical protein